MERTPYWIIQYGVIIDFLAVPAVAIFVYGVHLHWKKIRTGKTQLRLSLDNLRSISSLNRLPATLWNGLLGARVYRRPVTGLFHGLVFWGMLVLFIGTILVLLNVVFGMKVMSGGFYKWYMALTLDAAGLVVLGGVGFLLIRRLTRYPRLSHPKSKPGFILTEIFLIVVILTGFILEGQRIQMTAARETAFVGNLVAMAMKAMSSQNGNYIFMWWLHGLIALAFIAWLPFSPLSHLLFVPVNAALAEPIMGADEKALDVAALESDNDDNLPTLGTPTLADYSAKRRLDFSACLWCGRCQEVCPATLTEKTLTPKGVMVVLSEALRKSRISDSGIIDAIGMPTLFECRTCGACAETCPAMINPLKAIWGMRQNLMMERGEMPTQMVSAYRNMEARMHPFSSQLSPSDWRKDLEVPIFKAGETEYLLWVGCAVAYEDRAQQIGRAMVKLLNEAGVSYGIIEDARCTGDPAKQMGDDYLFAQLANANIDLFNIHRVKKIITLCPHCYNSFRHYYPPLGGEYEVTPHATMIKELICSDKLKLACGDQNITYHDPCYLGRHNRIYEDSRSIIGLIGHMIELPRSRSNSFCCGAGGGNYWNEETGKRINYARAREAFESGADLITTACPFCLLMLTDGLKTFTDDQRVFDLSELVQKASKDSLAKM
jgi:Fe-S oxidoreductase/nitrate reductase gamma subunit